MDKGQENDSWFAADAMASKVYNNYLKSERYVDIKGII